MKRFFALSFLVCTLVCTAAAQMASEYGVRGGITWARISESNTLPGTTDHITRYAFGVFAELEMYRHLFIHYELLYAMRGTRRVLQSGGDNGPPYSLTVTRQLGYLDPSIYAGVPVVRSTDSRIGLFAGATLAFAVLSRNTVDGIFRGESYRSHSRGGDAFLSIDPSLVIGMNAHYGLPVGTVSVDLRYSHSLMNIWDRGVRELPADLADPLGLDSMPEMRNRTFSLMIGLGIL
jgi:hypothetical protein